MQTRGLIPRRWRRSGVALLLTQDDRARPARLPPGSIIYRGSNEPNLLVLELFENQERRPGEVRDPVREPTAV